MRPTIEDLARAAGVSRSTVNRVIGRPSKVRPATRQLVTEAAAEIGYYGLPTLTKSARAEGKPFRLTLLMQQPNRWFCEQLAGAMQHARDDVAHHRRIRLKTERLSDFSPEVLAERLTAQGRQSDAIALVAAEHPIIIRAVEQLAESGVPVYALVTTLSAPSLAGYVGLNARTVGRTAAWALDRLCGRSGPVGILVGSPRYRAHEIAESGFRSYFREHNPAVQLLEPMFTFESDGIAREMTERLLMEHPEMQRLYLAGGGTLGMLSALRESGRAKQIATLAYDLTEDTRSALLDNTLDLVIAHRFQDIGRCATEMILSNAEGSSIQGRSTSYTGFDLITPESVE